MAETLLEKAQRLGIQPQGREEQPESLLQKAQRLNIQPANPSQPISETPQEKLSLGNIIPTIGKKGGEIGTGATKGALSTLLSPIQSIGGVISAATTKAAGTGLQESLAEGTQATNKAFELAYSYPENDPRRQKLLDIAREGQKTGQEVRGMQTGITQDIEGFKDPGQVQTKLQPKGTYENIGFTGEKIAEFLIPSTKVISAQRAITAGVEGTKLAKTINVFTKTLTEKPTFLPRMLGKTISGSKELAEIGLRTIPEAVSAYGVTKAQGGDDDEAIRNAKWAAGISGGLGVGVGVLSATGSAFLQAGRKMYQSALKPSLSKKAPPPTRVVETGLREGIRLTEYGVNKTARVIDNLEEQLGKVIEKSATNGKVSTANIRPFIDEAKNILGDTVDVEGSKQAIQTIDNLYDNFVKKYGDFVDIDVAQTLKTNTYQVLRNSYGELANATREGMKQLVRGLKEGIVDVAPEAGTINARLKLLYEFDEALGKAKGRIGNLNLLGLGTKILATGSPKVQLLAVANYILGSPLSKSGFGIMLHRFGTFLKKLSPEEASKFITSQTGKKIYERLTGQSLNGLSPSEKKIAQEITSYFDNPRLGMSIEDVSKKSIGQQVIKLTSEIKAKIRGELPILKQLSGKIPFMPKKK